MIDFILAGLSAGLFAFLLFFIVSFVTLGMVTVTVQLLAMVYRWVLAIRGHTYQEQTA